MGISYRNQQIFASQVDEYDHIGLRADEVVLVEQYFLKPKAHVLVIGCGAGRTLIPLLERGFSVTGIDVVPEMVLRARHNVESFGDRAQVLQMDAASLLFADQTFDYVIAPFHSLCYVLPHPRVAVAEIARVLRPDGTFLGNLHNRFYLKKLWRLWRGAYDTYQGILTYRTTPFDAFRFRKFFTHVRRVARMNVIPFSQLTWKDKIYRALSFFDKSMYYVCTEPRRL